MAQDSSGESYLDRHKRLRKESRADFREGRAKLTYYMLSLPFALASVAIASFRYPEHWALIVIEIAAWILFLGAGAAGLVAKHAEVERYRLRSIQSSVAVQERQSGRKPTPASADISLNREHAIVRAEKRESLAEAWHRRLLVAGGVAWVVSRTAIAMSTVGAFGAGGS